MLRIVRVVAFGVLITSSSLVFAKEMAIQNVENDKFSQAIKINGAMVYVNPFGGTFRSWFLQSFINKKTKEITHRLYLEISYIGEVEFFNAATDETATTLETVNIDTKVGNCFGGCDIKELVSITIPNEVVNAEPANDYQIKVTAKRGDFLIITIEKGQIALQRKAESTQISE